MSFPDAKTAKYGYDTAGNKIELKPIDLEDASGTGSLRRSLLRGV